MVTLERSRAAVAKLAALADVRPDLAPIARAAAGICEAVLDDAAAAVAAAKSETLAEIEKSAESTAAFQETVEARDTAETKAINLELEVSALRAKSAMLDAREQRSKRVEIAKSVAEAEQVEKDEVRAQVGAQLTLVYLWKRTRHAVTRKNFIESPMRASGPWEMDTPDGRTILYETRKDVVDAATKIVERSLDKSVPAESDPANQSHLDGKKKPSKYPGLAADSGSADTTYDSKEKSERVPISKSSGKRRPKWAR